jgi:hypothetical protein
MVSLMHFLHAQRSVAGFPWHHSLQEMKSGLGRATDLCALSHESQELSLGPLLIQCTPEYKKQG